MSQHRITYEILKYNAEGRRYIGKYGIAREDSYILPGDWTNQ